MAINIYIAYVQVLLFVIIIIIVITEKLIAVQTEVSDEVINSLRSVQHHVTEYKK